jgi:acyl carrier protein
MKTTTETAWDKLTAIVKEVVGEPEAGLTRGTTKDDLGADSLDMVEIVIAIEQECELKKEIPDEVAEEWKNLGDIADWIEKNAIGSKS